MILIFVPYLTSTGLNPIINLPYSNPKPTLHGVLEALLKEARCFTWALWASEFQPAGSRHNGSPPALTSTRSGRAAVEGSLGLSGIPKNAAQ